MSFLLVHGAGMSATCWDRLTPLLTGRVVAVDLPGRGTRAAQDLRTMTRADLHLDSGHMAMISIPETLAKTLNHIG
ncbi:alpha/beta fold hydrolase [Williamsia muralis]|uniref:alpha/beta fold hydrolase n=1 Tax=Williamsia marianensis TaxID=85044 RepID=UPI003F15DC5E